jgi:hypothetical protein
MSEEAVLRVFARLANHEALKQHVPREVRSCAYCELAQMFENMMAQLKNASEEASRQIARSITAARGSTEGPQPGQDNEKGDLT